MARFLPLRATEMLLLLTELELHLPFMFQMALLSMPLEIFLWQTKTISVSA
jgi:hypothetical protein